jgi:hypothetical protein
LSALPDTSHSSKSVKASKLRAQDRLLNSLVNLVLQVFKSIDPRSWPHRHVFDGIAYFILARCGELVYTLEFGHKRPASIAAEIVADAETFSPSVWTPEIAMAEREARFIFPLAKHLVSVTPHFFHPQSQSQSQSSSSQASGRGVMPPPTTTTTRGSAVLPSHAMERLQHTLLKHIWEENGDFCIQTINKPTFVGTVPEIPKTAAEDKRFWFVEELWNMFGWEMLGKDKHIS